MQRIMHDIFSGLGTSMTILLGDLRSVNPDLYNQILAQAENEARNLWRQKVRFAPDL
jgi:ABC-type sugar transport system permease subunit